MICIKIVKKYVKKIKFAFKKLVSYNFIVEICVLRCKFYDLTCLHWRGTSNFAQTMDSINTFHI